MNGRGHINIKRKVGSKRKRKLGHLMTWDVYPVDFCC